MRLAANTVDEIDEIKRWFLFRFGMDLTTTAVIEAAVEKYLGALEETNGKQVEEVERETTT